MALPAIPEPQTTPLPALLDACVAVVEWASTCDDLATVQEVYDRFAAIAEYLTKRDASREANAVMRRLEVRIGQLLGPAPAPGRPRANVPREVQIPRNRGHEFRKLAANAHVVEAAIEQSSNIQPASRRQVLKAITKLERAVKVAAMGAVEVPSPDATPALFSAIVIDPPWRYDNVATRGAAEDHYPTMSMEELSALTIPADVNAHLYLWATNGFLREGFDLLDAWGFTYKTCLTWVKPQIGMGNWFRNSTEHVLFAVRGKLATRRNDVPTWFKADRTRHSAKPESFYDLVEACSPGPYMEMFARRRRFGWHQWGNEA